MMEVDLYCKKCGTRNGQEISVSLICQGCQKELVEYATESYLENRALNQCPFCGCEHLYQRKDFNQKLGVGLLILGVAGSFFTYGLSLAGVSLLDWFLYRRVGWVGCCYQCKAQFRKSAMIDRLAAFELGLHDFYKNV